MYALSSAEENLELPLINLKALLAVSAGSLESNQPKLSIAFADDYDD